ncbi:MAG: hypothetical protein LUF90_09270 [Rikenellaceae bacterium]|nr:hypothetical protein [Rikenellaceae bacterium]
MVIKNKCKLEVLMFYEGRAVKVPLDYLDIHEEYDIRNIFSHSKFRIPDSGIADNIMNERKDANSKEVSVCSYCNVLKVDLIHNGQIRTARAYASSVKRFIGFTGNNNISFDEIDNSLLKK